jgi:KDO2-lipid IV(A) lauroyltransferase
MNNGRMQTLLRWTLIAIGALPLAVLHGFGWLLGNLLWLLPNKLKRITQLHLERCFPQWPQAQRNRVARRSLIESAKAVAEAPAIWFGSQRRLRRWLDDENTQTQVRALLADGKGVILLTPHLGSWEIAGQFLAAIDDLTLLYKPQKGASNAVILSGRARNPKARPVPTSAAGVKELLGALRRGEMIGILPDHDPPESSSTRFAPLFGMPANTMDLVGKLASRIKAPVWLIVAERLPWARGFRFHMQVVPAEITDPERGTRVLNQALETCIARWPQQYWWSYKRYRRQPPGAVDFYRDI